MNQLLQSVCDQACSDLAAQFNEAGDELLASIHKAEAEAQLQESPMKFNIGFKISIDLDKSIVTNSLSWSVKHSLETSHQIEDPLQTKLPLNVGRESHQSPLMEMRPTSSAKLRPRCGAMESKPMTDPEFDQLKKQERELWDAYQKALHSTAIQAMRSEWAAANRALNRAQIRREILAETTHNDLDKFNDNRD